MRKVLLASIAVAALQLAQLGGALAQPVNQPVNPGAEAPMTDVMATKPPPENGALNPQIATANAVDGSAGELCQPRTTSVHFAPRATALDVPNSDAIERAIDSASVCQIAHVVITDHTRGARAALRQARVRDLLVSRGIQAQSISVEADSVAAADANQLDVRMSFVGVARS